MIVLCISPSILLADAVRAWPRPVLLRRRRQLRGAVIVRWRITVLVLFVCLDEQRQTQHAHECDDQCRLLRAATHRFVDDPRQSDNEQEAIPCYESIRESQAPSPRPRLHAARLTVLVRRMPKSRSASCISGLLSARPPSVVIVAITLSSRAGRGVQLPLHEAREQPPTARRRGRAGRPRCRVRHHRRG